MYWFKHIVDLSFPRHRLLAGRAIILALSQDDAHDGLAKEMAKQWQAGKVDICLDDALHGPYPNEKLAATANPADPCPILLPVQR